MSQGCPNIHIYSVYIQFLQSYIKVSPHWFAKISPNRATRKTERIRFAGTDFKKQTRDVAFGYHSVGLGQDLTAIHKRPG